jgi:Haem-degrading
MPEASIFGSLQRPKLLGAKVADIVQNGGSSIEDAPLPLDPDPENDDRRECPPWTIKVGEDTIGAIGVSGAPGGDKDEACAKAGIEKVAADLK